MAIDMKYINIDKDRIGDLSNLNDKGVVILISDEKENEVASATITAYQSDDIERKFLNA